MTKKSVLLIAFLFVWSAHEALATHGSVSTGLGHAGPITTISASTLPKGEWVLELFTEYQEFDTFSDAELNGFTAQGLEEIHNVDYLVSVFAGVAYGVTDNLSLHLRIPYIYRNNISENPESLGDEIEFFGDSNGIGDLKILGHYRFFNRADASLESTLFVGLKIPTGRKGDEDVEGKRIEAEFQPGSGSWDPSIGLAVTKRFGIVSLDSNINYTFTTEGSQDTDLGDEFNYNVGLSYRALQRQVSLDVILEVNGVWRDKEKNAGIEDENSGGNIVFISPGARFSLDNRLGVYLSFGFPVAQDLNGEQNDIDYRIVSGVTLLL